MNHPNRNWRRRLEHEAAALGPDLVAAYISVMEGPTRAAAALSEQTGRNYTANLLCRWRRGEAPTPDIAQDAMRSVVAERLFGEDTGHSVARVMSPPAR